MKQTLREVSHPAILGRKTSRRLGDDGVGAQREGDGHEEEVGHHEAVGHRAGCGSHRPVPVNPPTNRPPTQSAARTRHWRCRLCKFLSTQPVSVFSPTHPGSHSLTSPEVRTHSLTGWGGGSGVLTSVSPNFENPLHQSSQMGEVFVSCLS